MTPLKVMLSLNSTPKCYAFGPSGQCSGVFLGVKVIARSRWLILRGEEKNCGQEARVANA